MTYLDAVKYFEQNGFDAPDPADYGVWVPGIPVLIGNGLEKAGCADWLSGLILTALSPVSARCSASCRRCLSCS